jgi:hypothetical protein
MWLGKFARLLGQHRFTRPSRNLTQAALHYPKVLWSQTFDCCCTHYRSNQASEANAASSPYLRKGYLTVNGDHTLREGDMPRRNSSRDHLLETTDGNDQDLSWPMESQAPSKTTTAKSLRFGTVEIHEHEYNLGCHASDGADIPLTIAWHASSSTSLSLDDYEGSKLSKETSMLYQRSDSKIERWNVLERMGFPLEEVREAQARCESLRRHELVEKERRERHNENMTPSSNVQPPLKAGGHCRGILNRIYQRAGFLAKKRTRPSFDDI